MKYNKPLLRCIRCPTAYHSGDFCVTAGTVQITSSQIICPKVSRTCLGWLALLYVKCK